ncbi:hypothetical protein ATORI0001_0630 [Lancefieldella rimae ATCC 49626]|uniref:Uncharacterized protein n=1 Tax=Lancefieldella rimae (strain ATCC 49626 / DSM 7090 / CCUG 31168 / NBRC 15546 / VPI D140H-11A) TaxID=553184 RepID=B9CKS1_LANR4|nr:hypothetical protein ATORI0001_0630 [Lancefieldella rimae ATCC 49626]
MNTASISTDRNCGDTPVNTKIYVPATSPQRLCRMLKSYRVL